MNKKNIFTVIFFIFPLLLFSCFQKDNSVNLLGFFSNVENKFSEIEKINFRYYRNYNNEYLFSKSSVFAFLVYNKSDEVKITDFYNGKQYDLKDLPENYYKDFQEVKRICDGLNVYEIIKDSLNRKMEFLFNIKYVKTETIPKWNQKV